MPAVGCEVQSVYREVHVAVYLGAMSSAPTQFQVEVAVRDEFKVERVLMQ